jgi:hypothetical protein
MIATRYQMIPQDFIDEGFLGLTFDVDQEARHG